MIYHRLLFEGVVSFLALHSIYGFTTYIPFFLCVCAQGVIDLFKQFPKPIAYMRRIRTGKSGWLITFFENEAVDAVYFGMKNHLVTATEDTTSHEPQRPFDKEKKSRSLTTENHSRRVYAAKNNTFHHPPRNQLPAAFASNSRNARSFTS